MLRPLALAIVLISTAGTLAHVHIALAACRATDPIGTAHAYIANYDRIVELMDAPIRNARDAPPRRPSARTIRSGGRPDFIDS
jgi:hypothetical protein